MASLADGGGMSAKIAAAIENIIGTERQENELEKQALKARVEELEKQLQALQDNMTKERAQTHSAPLKGRKQDGDEEEEEEEEEEGEEEVDVGDDDAIHFSMRPRTLSLGKHASDASISSVRSRPSSKGGARRRRESLSVGRYKLAGSEDSEIIDVDAKSSQVKASVAETHHFLARARSALVMGMTNKVERGASFDSIDEDDDSAPTFQRFKKAQFSFVMCTDERCETFQPAHSIISSAHVDFVGVKLIWKERPRNVLIVKKPNDPESFNLFVDITKFLVEERQMNVVVEPVVHKGLDEDLKSLTQTWNEGALKSVHKHIDFVVCIGGDGTLLWVSHLFNGPCPPCISFAMGSMGFLTPFAAKDFHEALDKLIKSGATLSLRSRVKGVVKRDADAEANASSKETESFHALNEILIDRGPSTSLSNLMAYCNGTHLTRVQADGLLVATPTGSTAYSLSAGGSIVHPSVASLLLTFVCPHNLTSRPLLLPDSATLRIEVPHESRATAWAAFDGKNRTELKHGDSISCTISPYPLACVCKTSERNDWLTACTKTLQWNVRSEQKPFAAQKKNAT
eukprot:g676.t1